MNLTKKRAKIFIEYFYPLIDSNLDREDGDLYSAYQNYTNEELRKSLDAVWEVCYRREKVSKQKKAK